MSKAQERAMQAAAHGHSDLGIPKSVGEEFVDATPKDAELPEHVKMFRAARKAHDESKKAKKKRPEWAK